MGTRADFYVVQNSIEKPYTKFEWLGSVGMDGYPDAFLAMEDIKDEGNFRKFLAADVGWTKVYTEPSQGWPWPWDDSNLTDYTYAFDSTEGTVIVARFGKGWVPFKCACDSARRGNEDLLYDPLEESSIDFPYMSEIQNLALDDRSGLIFLTAGPEKKSNENQRP